MRTKYHYGEIYEVHPTCGIDIEKGKIQVMGICNHLALPQWVDIEAWIQGMDKDFVDEILDEPWYLIEILEGIDEGEITCLPEFALDEVFHKARKIKIERWRNARHMEA